MSSPSRRPEQAADAAAPVASARPAAAPPQPPPRRPRARQTAWDMVRSLAVLAVFLVPVLLFVPRPAEVERRPVDVAAVAAGADEADILLPVPDLPSAWEPNAARWDRTGPDGVPTWHVGYVTPAGAYAGLEVARDATRRWLGETTLEGEPAGTQEVAGVTWDVYSAPGVEPRRLSLVREDGGVTTVVTGTAATPELVTLATAVQQARAAAQGQGGTA